MPLGLERRGTNGERRRGSCRHRLKRTVAERVGGEKRIRVTFRLSLIGSYPPISTIEFENVLGKFLIPSSIVFFYHQIYFQIIRLSVWRKIDASNTQSSIYISIKCSYELRRRKRWGSHKNLYERISLFWLSIRNLLKSSSTRTNTTRSPIFHVSQILLNTLSNLLSVESIEGESFIPVGRGGKGGSLCEIVAARGKRRNVRTDRNGTRGLVTKGRTVTRIVPALGRRQTQDPAMTPRHRTIRYAERSCHRGGEERRREREEKERREKRREGGNGHCGAVMQRNSAPVTRGDLAMERAERRARGREIEREREYGRAVYSGGTSR